MDNMTKDEARAVRAAYEAEVRRLSRLGMGALRDIDRQQLEAEGTIRLLGGPGSKDELINEILRRQWPLEVINYTTHVLYHNAGETWSACKWCHPHDGVDCECELRPARANG